MNVPLPLYKYLKPDVAKIVLRSGELRWSTPALFDDPYDVQFDLAVQIDESRVAEAAADRLMAIIYGGHTIVPKNPLGILALIAKDRMKKGSEAEFRQSMVEGVRESLRALYENLPSFQEAVRTELGSSKILCLSEIADSLLMWSLYADSHKGVVLGFGMATGFDSPWRMAQPMNYLDDIPNLYTEEFWVEMLSGGADLTPEGIYNQILYTKSRSWEAQKEWRIVSGSGWKRDAKFEDVSFHPRELKQVIFGCNADVSLRNEISALVQAQYPEAKLLEARKSNVEFGIRITPIEL